MGRRSSAQMRRSNLKKRYNITPEFWQSQLTPDCPVCERPFDMISPRGWNTPHTDHCHATGKFRGIICGRCNTMLGNARDSIRILINAIKYLLRTQWKNS